MTKGTNTKGANPFAAVWNGMTRLAERLVALEGRTPSLRIGRAADLPTGQKFCVREIEIAGETLSIVTVEDDK